MSFAQVFGVIYVVDWSDMTYCNACSNVPCYREAFNAHNSRFLGWRVVGGRLGPPFPNLASSSFADTTPKIILVDKELQGYII